MLVPVASNNQKVMLHLISIFSPKEYSVAYFGVIGSKLCQHQCQCCHWHHMILMLVPMASHDKKFMLHLLLIIITNWMVPQKTLLASCDTDTCIIAFHDQKKKLYIAHFSICLDFMNTVVLLEMSFPSHDTDASAYSVKWLKKSCCITFWSFKLTNAVVLLMMTSVSCEAWTGANSIIRPKESCHTLFHLFWCNE